ncbi:MAG: hypothetical protein KAR11_02410 [Phycisphaerae bacterium]|nr:hypothetical protein [Phycisphaerae bacterium]
MLAAGLVQIWMIPPMLILLGGWIFFGGYLFQKSLLKHTDKRRVSYGSGVLTSFLCGSVGGVPAVLALFMGMNLGSGTGRMVSIILSAVAGLICFAVIAYLVVWTMLKKESAKTSFRVALVPIVVIIALGGVIGVGCGIPAYFQAQHRGFLNSQVAPTQMKLVQIYKALLRNFPTDPPQTLDVLIEKKLIPEDGLTSSAKPDGKGFFYHPPNKLLTRLDPEHQDQLLACDFAENFDGEFYCVIYTYGAPAVLGEQAFKVVLDEPINKEFAEAFRKADEK